MSDPTKPVPAQEQHKKPYKAPRLSRFGAIKHITAGGSGFLGENDMIPGQMMIMMDPAYHP